MGGDRGENISLASFGQGSHGYCSPGYIAVGSVEQERASRQNKQSSPHAYRHWLHTIKFVS